MPTKRMSKEHKEALSRGRTEAAAVRAYLSALDQGKKRGRKVDAKTLRERVKTLNEQISGEADPSRRLSLIQKRHDAEARLAATGPERDTSALERDFVKAVKGYSERRGIGYSAWREVGVPPSVLSKAGISRTRRTG